MQLIINIDGASRGNPGPGASAWVIKDAKGKTLAKDGVFFDECTNNRAEFTALLRALQKALVMGAKELIVKSDSQLLVRQYGGQYKVKNPQLQELMADIKKNAAKFVKVTIIHVPREQNKEADAMCNEVMDKALKKKPAKTQTLKEDAAPKKPANEKASLQPELFDLD